MLSGLEELSHEVEKAMGRDSCGVLDREAAV